MSLRPVASMPLESMTWTGLALAWFGAAMREPVITTSWMSDGLGAAVGVCARAGMQAAAHNVPSTRAALGALCARTIVSMTDIGSDTPERFSISGSLTTRRFPCGAHLAKVVHILRNRMRPLLSMDRSGRIATRRAATLQKLLFGVSLQQHAGGAAQKQRPYPVSRIPHPADKDVSSTACFGA